MQDSAEVTIPGTVAMLEALEVQETADEFVAQDVEDLESAATVSDDAAMDALEEVEGEGGESEAEEGDESEAAEGDDNDLQDQAVASHIPLGAEAAEGGDSDLQDRAVASHRPLGTEAASSPRLAPVCAAPAIEDASQDRPQTWQDRLGRPLDFSGSWYDVLAVDPVAPKRHITAAFRKISLVVHPDKGGDALVFTRLRFVYEARCSDSPVCTNPCSGRIEQ